MIESLNPSLDLTLVGSFRILGIDFAKGVTLWWQLHRRFLRFSNLVVNEERVAPLISGKVFHF